jgi:DNA polymerase elongation subunit (family B)
MDLYVIDWEAEDDVEDDLDDDLEQADPVDQVESSQELFKIRAFCRDNQSRPVVLTIAHFRPYFFIKVPDAWTTLKGAHFITELRNKVNKVYRDTLVEWKIIRAKPLYGFTAEDQFLYMKLEFSCQRGFNQYRFLFQNKLRLPGVNNGQPLRYEPFETNIPPLLRFLHVKNLKAVGWFNVKGAKATGPSGDYVLDLNSPGATISPLEERNETPAIVTMAFDIECDSSHGDFPVAIKDYLKLAQEIMTEYLALRVVQKNQVDCEKIVATFLKYAFCPFYNNNNIERVVLVDPPVKPELATILAGTPNPWSVTLAKDLYALLAEEVDILVLVEFMETQGPELNLSLSDYYRLCLQFQAEILQLKKTNNVAFQKHPVKVVELLLELAFDPWYTNYNINVIYFKGKRPAADILIPLAREIYAICEETYQGKLKHAKLAGLKTKPANYVPMSVAEQINRVNALLNDRLPTVAGDPLIQIGSTFKKQGAPDCYLKHIICLDTCEPILPKTLIDFEHVDITLPEKDLQLEAKQLNVAPADVYARKRVLQYETDQAEVIVESYGTEEEVLLAWLRLIQRTNPDLVTGYNIFGFDFKYIYDRARILGILDQFSYLGRTAGVQSTLVEQKLSSAALGDNTLYYISMNGRILIDLYNVVQKQVSLSSYKLDDVCREFLFKNKVDITPAQIFTKQKGSAADRRIIAEYCLIDCILCNRLMDKLEILTNNTGMAQVCSVPLSFLFLRGQGIKLLSYVAKECRTANLLLPVIEAPKTPTDEWYEGAIVLEPQKAIHLDPVGVLDFNSLYPSCMISENLTFEHFIGSITVPLNASTDYRGKTLTENTYEAALVKGDLTGWDYVDITYDNYTEVPISEGRKTMVKKVSGHTICRFAQPPNGGKGLVPRILMSLLDSRKSTKKKRDTFPKGSFEYNLFESLQLAYKVTANSLYGIIGANTSKIKLKAIAACTTAVGRGLIYKTANFIKENYAGSDIVYGDTDSVFIKFDCRAADGTKLKGLPAVYKSMDLCMEAAERVNGLMKKPHNIEFEKVIYPFILARKKGYHGHYFTNPGSPKYSVKSMGIVLKRRDNAPIVKHVFGGMLDIIMKEQDTPKAVAFVKTECQKVLQGGFPIDMFIITKTLRSYYALPESVAHNVLAQRIGKRDPGNKPRSNDRIAYVYIEKPGVKIQGERIETPEFIQKNRLKLDYPHYITNQIAKPVLQILELAGLTANIFEEILQDYTYKRDGIQRITDAVFNCIKIQPRSTTGFTFRAIVPESSSEDEED